VAEHAPPYAIPGLGQQAGKNGSARHGAGLEPLSRRWGPGLSDAINPDLMTGALGWH